jgi:hypothetical protein
LIASRVVLPLAAAVLPVLATVVLCVVFRMSLDDFRGAAIAAVLAAQIAVLLGWPLLVRSVASAWLAPLGIGLLMAVVTHILFGPMFAALLLGTEKHSAAGEIFSVMVGVSIYAALFVGWASVPLIMALCVLVNRLHRKELHRAAV